jgi:hypothetical protein
MIFFASPKVGAHLSIWLIKEHLNFGYAIGAPSTSEAKQARTAHKVIHLRQERTSRSFSTG